MNTNEQMRSHFVAIHDVIKKYITKEINDTSLCLRIKNIVNKALALPQRNCDVGTAEEQAERFRRFCGKHKPEVNEFTELGELLCPSTGCELIACNYGKCSLAWAQLPYEKGENNE